MTTETSEQTIWHVPDDLWSLIAPAEDTAAAAHLDSIARFLGVRNDEHTARFYPAAQVERDGHTQRGLG